MIIESSLVNAEHLDPALYLFLPETGEALLVDCGYIFPLKARDIQRISAIFISHFHIDHAIGLDHVIRVCLGMPDKEMAIYGPPGTIERVEGRLRGYLWNLCTDFSLNFRVHEVDGDVVRWTLLTGYTGFLPTESGTVPFAGGVLVRTPHYTVKAAFLEHKYPVMAFAVEAAPSMNVDKEAMAKMKLSGGPWIKALKEESPPAELTVDGRTFDTAQLRDAIVKTTPGRKIAYVTDTIFNKSTVKAAKALIRGADELYCEAPYLTSEKELAREHFHMTAKQAATLAAEGEVKRLHLFHFSRRYNENYGQLFEEASSFFPATERAPQYSGA